MERTTTPDRGDIQQLVLIGGCLLLASARSHWGAAIVASIIAAAAIAARIVNQRSVLSVSWGVYIIVLAVALAAFAIW